MRHLPTIMFNGARKSSRETSPLISENRAFKMERFSMFSVLAMAKNTKQDLNKSQAEALILQKVFKFYRLGSARY